MSADKSLPDLSSLDAAELRDLMSAKAAQRREALALYEDLDEQYKEIDRAQARLANSDGQIPLHVLNERARALRERELAMLSGEPFEDPDDAGEEEEEAEEEAEEESPDAAELAAELSSRDKSRRGRSTKAEQPATAAEPARATEDI